MNAFEMCRKGEIKQENIEIRMKIISQLQPSEEDSYDEEEGASDEED